MARTRATSSSFMRSCGGDAWAEMAVANPSGAILEALGRECEESRSGKALTVSAENSGAILEI